MYGGLGVVARPRDHDPFPRDDDDDSDSEDFVIRMQKQVERDFRDDPSLFEKVVFLVLLPSFVGVVLVFVGLLLTLLGECDATLGLD